MEIFDVIIAGGGPAGMSAALILGRSRRKILIFDTGNQRNKNARMVNGYLSRDGTAPDVFRSHCLKDLEKYYISLQDRGVTDISREEGLFRVEDDLGETYYSKRVLISTGVKDNIPDLPGMEDFYGISVHHCPFCDGWEVADKPLAVYGQGKAVSEGALHIRHWSKDIRIVTNGRPRLNKKARAEVEKAGVEIIQKKIAGLEGTNGWLKGIRFVDGDLLKCDALFLATGFRHRWKAPEKLNLRYTRKHDIWTDRLQQSSVKGLYVAGDAAWDMKLVIIAAADGAKAAVAIHNSLFEEERRR